MSKLSPEGGKLHDASFAEAKSLPEGLNKAFTQQELMKLGNIEGPSELMRIVQELVQHSLFRTLKADRTLLWSARPKDVASAYVGSRLSALENDERLIYEAIENSDTSGIWLKRLKMSTGVAPGNVAKIVKKLEGTKLVKLVQSVKNPAQRTYMLQHLQPGKEVTGGSFFDSGDLDEGLVQTLADLIIFYVQKQSWANVKPKSIRERNTSPIEIDGDDDTNSKKRKRSAVDIEDAVPPKRLKPEFRITQAAYPAGSRTYPTIDAIHNFLTNTDAIRSNKAADLTTREVQEIVNVLHWDGKLEKVANGYRTVLGVKHEESGAYQYNEPGEDVGNGLTEAPCGRCPVFDICSDTGPVNPGNCVYFENWLKA